MKHLANSTELFIKTLKRQAVANVNGREVILDQDLYTVYQLYAQGKMKFQDHVIECTLITSGLTSFKMLDEADAKITGVRNIALAKLNENEYFCPVAISILGATTTADTTASLQASAYAPIDALPILGNGKVDFIINQTEYLMREAPLSKWTNLELGAGSDAPKGSVVLDNLSIMKPNLRNEINFTLGVAAPALSAVRVLLFGTRTQPK